MNLNKYTTPSSLERYSFLWSEARLVIASVALFIGGRPPALAFNPISALYGLVSSLLTLSWIISGLASAYLVYRWNAERKLFGGKDSKDTTAFFVMVVSGFNLGLAGLLGRNIGMTISSNYFIFVIVGLIYLVSAWQLYSRWKVNGEKIF